MDVQAHGRTSRAPGHERADALTVGALPVGPLPVGTVPVGTLPVSTVLDPSRQRRLHLVRHGQSTWNAQGRVQGQTMNVPLTPLGWAQASRAAHELARWHVASVVTSDQLRARQTAEVIASHIGLSPAPDPRLREQALGSLEGRLVAEAGLPSTSPGSTDPWRRWGGGESVDDVFVRVGALLDEAVSDDAPGDVVLVSHGDTVRIALAWLRGLGPDEVPWEALANGAVTTIPLQRNPS